MSSSTQYIEGNTSSESNKVMARGWFQRCRNRHPWCTPAGYSGRRFPTRLLEVDIPSNGPTVKVIETKSRQDIEYMTLSHCWGGSLPLRLLIANLEAYRTSIDFSRLPKTFRDALSVVGWFGIKYLWIDALCIIQDSDDDWAHESGCMRNYYKYSFGTIAATGASNPSEGLFFDRNPAFVPPFRAIIGRDGQEKAVAVTAGGWCRDKLEKEPLNRRGWVLQERLLSPRILHFGRTHMSWECQTEMLCETWPIIFPSSAYSRSSFNLKAEYTLMSHNLFRFSLGRLWREIVSTYSSMALTRLRDRCVAFAGIAEEIQAVTRDDYVAGLWRRDLPEALLWRVDTSSGKQRYPNELPARSQSYLAPSWSWLSIKRAIELPVPVIGKISELVAINAHVENVTENKFGDIKHAVIKGWGALIPAICMLNNAHWWFHSIRRKIIGESRFGYICIDEEYIEEPDRFLYCLPVLDDNPDNLDSGRVQGLLLVPTFKTTAEYRRIGIFHMDKPQAHDLLKVPRAFSDDLKGKEFESFTLV